MKLTIAVPTYNRSKELSELIQELRFLNGSKVIEINIHDNSDLQVQSENLKSIPKEFNYFPNKKNFGFAGNIKECVSNASGEFLWIIADDDELDLSQVAFIVEVLNREAFDILALPFNVLPQINLPLKKTDKKIKIENTFGFSVTGSMQLIDCCRSSGHDIYNYLNSAIVRTEIMKRGLEMTAASDNAYYHALCMLRGAKPDSKVHYIKTLNMLTYLPPAVVQFNFIKLVTAKFEMAKVLQDFYGMNNTNKKVLEQITAWLFFEGMTSSSIVCSRQDFLGVLNWTLRFKSAKSLAYCLLGRLPLVLRRGIYSAYLYKRELGKR